MTEIQCVYTLPCVCDKCERLSQYLSQTTRELLDAQELTGSVIAENVLAAATAWKRARRMFEEHAIEHGFYGRPSVNAKPPEPQTSTVPPRLNRIVSAIRFWRLRN